MDDCRRLSNSQSAKLLEALSMILGRELRRVRYPGAEVWLLLRSVTNTLHHPPQALLNIEHSLPPLQPPKEGNPRIIAMLRVSSEEQGPHTSSLLEQLASIVPLARLTAPDVDLKIIVERCSARKHDLGA